MTPPSPAPTAPRQQELARRAFLKRSLAALAGAGLAGWPQRRVRAQANPAMGPSGDIAAALGPDRWTDPGLVEEVLAPALSGCPTTIARLLKGLRVLDARSAADYAAGHLPTAASAPPEAFNQERDGVPDMLAPLERLIPFVDGLGLDPQLETVLYSDEANLGAARLYWLLDYLGHPRLRLLDGGSTLWQAEGHAWTAEAPTLPEGTFVPDPDASKIADTPWVAAHLDDPETVFVDARDRAGYEQGHLPGAVSLPWRSNVDPDSDRLRPIGEVLQRYAAAGVLPGRTVVCYCQLGILSAHHYALLRTLGFPRVRLYDGSWAAWSLDPTRPVETGPGAAAQRPPD